jgi:hypothetical protein
LIKKNFIKKINKFFIKFYKKNKKIIFIKKKAMSGFKILVNEKYGLQITDDNIIGELINTLNWDDEGYWVGIIPPNMINNSYYNDTENSLLYRYIDGVIIRIPYNRDVII